MEPNPYVDFKKVREVNQWWMWVNYTLIPNVRVQNWYNGAPPYGLRGYLDDRVNRIIGYAVVRQVREKPGTCHTNKIMRDFVDSCTGQLGVPVFYEDTKTYCQGWKPLLHENCTRMGEFEYMTQEERESRNVNADFSYYSGGGYELRLRGHIDELKERLRTLQQEDWIDNRTRALITEFSFYNAQVNLFGVVKIVAEFVGGGILPYYRVDILSLTREWNVRGYITFACEILFILSTLYYIINSLGILKQMGVRAFFKEAWNIVDVFTIGLSVQTVGESETSPAPPPSPPHCNYTIITSRSVAAEELESAGADQEDRGDEGKQIYFHRERSAYQLLLRVHGLLHCLHVHA